MLEECHRSDADECDRTAINENTGSEDASDNTENERKIFLHAPEGDRFFFFLFFHTNSHTRSKQRQTQLELIIYALFSLCARCDVSISEELKAALKTCRSQRARSRHWEKSVKDLAHRGWYEKKPAGLLYLQLRKLANLALFIRLPPALCAFTSVCACTFIFARGDQVFLLRQNRARRGKCVLEVSYHQGHKPHAHRSVFLYQK